MLIRFRETADQQQPAGGEQPSTKPQIFGVPLQVTFGTFCINVKTLLGGQEIGQAHCEANYQRGAGKGGSRGDSIKGAGGLG